MEDRNNMRSSDKQHLVDCEYRNPSLCKDCLSIYSNLVIKNKLYKSYDLLLQSLNLNKLYNENILNFDVFKNAFNFFIFKNLRNNRNIFGNIRYSSLSGDDKEDFNQIINISLYLIFNEYKNNNAEIKDYYENTPLLLLKYACKEWSLRKKQLYELKYKQISLSNFISHKDNQQSLHEENSNYNSNNDPLIDYRLEKYDLYNCSIYAKNNVKLELIKLSNDFKLYLNKINYKLFIDFYIKYKSKKDIYKENNIYKKKDIKIIDLKLMAIFDCIKVYYNKHESIYKKNINRKYIGVYKVSKGSYNKWRAAIRINNKYKHLGYYDSPEKAAYIYDNEVRNNKYIDRDKNRGCKPKYQINFPRNKNEKLAQPIFINKIDIHEIIKFSNVSKKERIKIFSKINIKANAKIQVYLDFFLNFKHGN